MRGTLWMGLAVVGASVGAVGWALSQRPDRSFILFTMDTARADHIQLYGYARDTMPTLGRLARDGVTFDQAYTMATESGPAHAAMLTGLRPHLNGVTRNAERLLPAVTTVAQRLRERGYRAVAFVSDALVGEISELDRGFDEFTLVQDNNHPRGAPPMSTALALFEQVAAYINTHPHGTFVWLHAQMPHGDYRPPLEFERLFRPDAEEAPGHDRCWLKIRSGVQRGTPPDEAELAIQDARYDAELALVDAGLALVVQTVNAVAPMDTAIVVTSDHGETLGTRTAEREWGHSFLCCEEIVRVPLVLWAPGVRRGRVSGFVFTNQVAATVEEWMGLPVTHGAPGLAAVARAGRGLTEFPRYVWPGGHGHRGAREGPHKFMMMDGRVRVLFDLEKDPGETRDILAERPDLLERLDVRLPAPERPGPEEAAPQMDPNVRRMLERGGYLERGDGGAGRVPR